RLEPGEAAQPRAPRGGGVGCFRRLVLGTNRRCGGGHLRAPRRRSRRTGSHRGASPRHDDGRPVGRPRGLGTRTSVAALTGATSRECWTFACAHGSSVARDHATDNEATGNDATDNEATDNEAAHVRSRQRRNVASHELRPTSPARVRREPVAMPPTARRPAPKATPHQSSTASGRKAAAVKASPSKVSSSRATPSRATPSKSRTTPARVSPSTANASKANASKARQRTAQAKAASTKAASTKAASTKAASAKVRRRNVRRIGIMGGTFDPIHHGHSVAASEAAHRFLLDEVVFVPSGQPWQKADYDVSPAEDRYLMTVIATASNPRFQVSRVDIDRPGPTYTVDTLRDLRSIYGPKVDLFFIAGADAFEKTLSWKDTDQILDLAHLSGVTRPGFVLSDAHLPADTVSLVQVPAMAISSTDCRARVASGQPIWYLVPDGVVQYIAKRGLYRES